MENTIMQIRAIIDRLYGVRLPVMETGAINALLSAAHDLDMIAQQLDKQAKAQAPAPEEPKE